MRLGLRWKILLLVVFAPATLGLAVSLTVHRNVSEHVKSSSIHENLKHSVSVFESTLRTRSRELAGVAQVIAQDPRFFSLLMLAPSQRDIRFVSTVRGMAHDFRRITEADLFEVLDRRGRLLASVGQASSTQDARASLVRAALRGRRLQEAILIEKRAHYQVVLAPVIADRQIVGVLMLGAAIGKGLAHELRSQMHCEVTFLSGSTVTGTTLRDPGDLSALMRAVSAGEPGSTGAARSQDVLHVHGSRHEYLTLVQRIPVSDPAAHQWYVMQRSFDPETTFLRAMQRDLLWLALIALAVSVVTALFFSEQILRPLQRLVRGAQEMKHGNYDYPLGIRRGDEIGYLAERFAEMRQREQAYLNGLEQATRLKSQFLSIASHELRTPISVLAGYQDLLSDGSLGPVTPRQRKALDTMRDYLGRLTHVAEDAAHFAQVQGERLELDFQKCTIGPIVRRAVGSALSQGVHRAVAVEVHDDGVEIPIEADPEALGHALVQLITNAIRFTPDGGRVDLRVSQHGETLTVEVQDTGVGISEDRIEAVLSHSLSAAQANHHRSAVGLEFNSFGLGLGLTIARGIVEGHGGRILATSRLGEGSTFVIRMPVRREDGARAAA